MSLKNQLSGPASNPHSCKTFCKLIILSNSPMSFSDFPQSRLGARTALDSRGCQALNHWLGAGCAHSGGLEIIFPASNTRGARFVPGLLGLFPRVGFGWRVAVPLNMSSNKMPFNALNMHCPGGSQSWKTPT